MDGKAVLPSSDSKGGHCWDTRKPEADSGRRPASATRSSSQMNVFEFRKRQIDDYSDYVTSFISIRDSRIQERVDEDLSGGLLWPEPSIGLNPSFAKGAWIDELSPTGHCTRNAPASSGSSLTRTRPVPGFAYTGTSLTPSMRRGRAAITSSQRARVQAKSGLHRSHRRRGTARRERRPGIKAIVVYPMNALANSQSSRMSRSGFYPEALARRNFTGPLDRSARTT